MATSLQRSEQIRYIQTAMGVGYTGMGLWCLVAPASVITLSLTAPYAVINRTTTLLMRCFGAQAATCGLLLGMAPMNRSSFAGFGLAMLPYLGFNAWFGIGPGRGVFTRWLAMDFVGNMVFMLGSAYCVKLLDEEKEEEESVRKSK